MRIDDKREITTYWRTETALINEKIDAAFRDAQDHAYELWLKRGKYDVMELAVALVKARDEEDKREWQAVIAAIYRIGESAKTSSSIGG